MTEQQQITDLWERRRAKMPHLLLTASTILPKHSRIHGAKGLRRHEEECGRVASAAGPPHGMVHPHLPLPLRLLRPLSLSPPPPVLSRDSSLRLLHVSHASLKATTTELCICSGHSCRLSVPTAGPADSALVRVAGLQKALVLPQCESF